MHHFALAMIIGTCYHCANGFTNVPRHELNLDLPPEERWTEIVKQYDPKMLTNELNKILGDLFSNPLLKKAALTVADDIEKYIKEPYASEIRGISKTLDADVGLIVIFNLFYDLFAYKGGEYQRACTSIVTMDKNNHVIHSRNMDFDYSDFLRNIAIDVEFRKGGKTLYIGTTFVGYVGVLNGVKPNRFSFSLDERTEGFWWENLIAALEKSPPSFITQREFMEKASSFEDAIQMAVKLQTISPNYFIIGGVKPMEGAVVVGDRWGSIDVSLMNSSLEHKWFVVETNYDPWRKPPHDDDRRDAAIKYMLQYGQDKMDVCNLFKVLSTPPVMNSDTIYTTTMAAYNVSIYDTKIRYP